MKTSKHPKLTNGQPAISCFGLSQVELIRRENAAHLRAERLAVHEHVRPKGKAAGSSSTPNAPWALSWPCVTTPCFGSRPFCPGTLLDMNGGQPLDFGDYAYVADVLREWLCNA